MPERGGLVVSVEARLMQIGDMAVYGTPSVKLLRALAAISTTLHPEFSRQPNAFGGEYAKNACVLTSLTVRDFLRDIGYADAEARPVMTVLRSHRLGTELHSLGLGVTDDIQIRQKGRWNGHMVAVVPEEGWLIDTTLYPVIRRPAWAGAMSGMMALHTTTETHYARNLRILGAYAARDGQGTVFECTWLDNPDNTGWRGPDAQRSKWRKPVIKALRDAFEARA